MNKTKTLELDKIEKLYLKSRITLFYDKIKNIDVSNLTEKQIRNELFSIIKKLIDAYFDDDENNDGVYCVFYNGKSFYVKMIMPGGPQCFKLSVKNQSIYYRTLRRHEDCGKLIYGDEIIDPEDYHMRCKAFDRIVNGIMNEDNEKEILLRQYLTISSILSSVDFKFEQRDALFQAGFLKHDIDFNIEIANCNNSFEYKILSDFLIKNNYSKISELKWKDNTDYMSLIDNPERREKIRKPMLGYISYEDLEDKVDKKFFYN